MIEKKIFVFDIDGTLLTSKHEILDSSIKAIKKLKELGYYVVIASGRTPAVIKLKEIDQYVDYYICSNGAFIMDKFDNLIYQSEIEKTLVDKLINRCVLDDVTLSFNFPDGQYVYHNFKVIKNIYEMWLNKYDFLIDDSVFKNHHSNINPYSGLVVGVGDIDNYMRLIPELEFELIHGNTYDIFSKGISKSSGISFICEELNLNMHDVIAFGDGYNDVKMINDAGIGIAMGNGIELLKIKADYLTDSNDNDGIYKALNYYKFI